jgi:hypothetical protein
MASQAQIAAEWTQRRLRRIEAAFNGVLTVPTACTFARSKSSRPRWRRLQPAMSAIMPTRSPPPNRHPPNKLNHIPTKWLRSAIYLCTRRTAARKS